MLAELPQQIDVRYSPGLVQVSGATSQRLRITAQSMLQGMFPSVSDRALDLVEIAAGVYAVDRTSRRSRTKANEAGARVLPICFHVSEPAYWGQPTIANQVAELLHFLTGDFWLISFAQGERVSRAGQSAIDLGWGRQAGHVALYSGGLDSAAGLANELLDGHRDFVLLTTGHQTSIRGRAIRQLKSLKPMLPPASSLTQLAFLVNLQNPARLRSQETTQRSRAFLFCAAGAVVAASCGVPAVHVYENGHGAINLPLSSGGLSGGFATRGAHPTFLSMMSALVSDTLSTPITFVLPFADVTKAEMVAKLAGTPGLEEWAATSRSCVHSSWREPAVGHCGYCAACIERHQSFIAAGVEDQTPYSRPLWTSTDPLSDDYLRAYLDDAQAWLEQDPRLLQRFRKHCAMSDLPQSERERLAQLCRRQAQEVVSVYGHLLRPRSLRVAA